MNGEPSVWLLSAAVASVLLLVIAAVMAFAFVVDPIR